MVLLKYLFRHNILLKRDCKVRQICFSYPKTARSHYQTLGLPNAATQADVKRAYYDLSMKLHPDKGKGNEEKFREITTAYEVLSSPRLRRMYDRGLLSDEQPDASIHYPPEPGPTGFAVDDIEKAKESIKTFDKWAQTHYSDTFSRSQYEKQTRKKLENRKVVSKESSGEKIIVVFFFFVIGVLSLIFIPKESNDDGSKKS